jgi:hypothetical protein
LSASRMRVNAGSAVSRPALLERSHNRHIRRGAERAAELLARSELTRQVPEPGVISWLDALPADEVAITAITAAELRYGVARLPSGHRRAALEAAAGDDFGHIVHRRPWAVLQPGGVDDVVVMVRFCNEQRIAVAARGKGTRSLESTGEWYDPHPWWNMFLPGSATDGFVSGVMAHLTEADIGASGVMPCRPGTA